MLRDLHNNTAAQAALQKKVQTLGKSTDAKVSHADVQHSVQLQRQQIAQVQKELDIKVWARALRPFAADPVTVQRCLDCVQVAVLSTATSKLATELSALQHHQEAAEKGAYAALCDVHKAVDRVNTEAAASLDRLRCDSIQLTQRVCPSQPPAHVLSDLQYIFELSTWTAVHQAYTMHCNITMSACLQ